MLADLVAALRHDAVVHEIDCTTALAQSQDHGAAASPTPETLLRQRWLPAARMVTLGWPGVPVSPRRCRSRRSGRRTRGTLVATSRRPWREVLAGQEARRGPPPDGRPWCHPL